MLRDQPFQEVLLVGEAGQKGGAEHGHGQGCALAEPHIVLLLQDGEPFLRGHGMAGDDLSL
jgi:hypothetical protein